MRYRVIRTTIFPHAPESTLPEERRILVEANAEVVPVSCGTPEELAALVQNADALFAGHIPTTAVVIVAMPQAAGLDVFEREPVAPDNPLLAMENVVTPPHTAGFSDEAIRSGRRQGAEELARILRGEMPRNLVNRDILLRRGEEQPTSR